MSPDPGGDYFDSVGGRVRPNAAVSGERPPQLQGQPSRPRRLSRSGPVERHNGQNEDAVPGMVRARRRSESELMDALEVLPALLRRYWKVLQGDEGYLRVIYDFAIDAVGSVVDVISSVSMAQRSKLLSSRLLNSLDSALTLHDHILAGPRIPVEVALLVVDSFDRTFPKIKRAAVLVGAALLRKSAAYTKVRYEDGGYHGDYMGSFGDVQSYHSGSHGLHGGHNRYGGSVSSSRGRSTGHSTNYDDTTDGERDSIKVQPRFRLGSPEWWTAAEYLRWSTRKMVWPFRSGRGTGAGAQNDGGDMRGARNTRTHSPFLPIELYGTRSVRSLLVDDETSRPFSKIDRCSIAIRMGVGVIVAYAIFAEGEHDKWPRESFKDTMETTTGVLHPEDKEPHLPSFLDSNDKHVSASGSVRLSSDAALFHSAGRDTQDSPIVVTPEWGHTATDGVELDFGVSSAAFSLSTSYVSGEEEDDVIDADKAAVFDAEVVEELNGSAVAQPEPSLDLSTGIVVTPTDDTAPSTNKDHAAETGNEALKVTRGEIPVALVCECRDSAGPLESILGDNKSRHTAESLIILCRSAVFVTGPYVAFYLFVAFRNMSLQRMVYEAEHTYTGALMNAAEVPIAPKTGDPGNVLAKLELAEQRIVRRKYIENMVLTQHPGVFRPIDRARPSVFAFAPCIQSGIYPYMFVEPFVCRGSAANRLSETCRHVWGGFPYELACVKEAFVVSLAEAFLAMLKVEDLGRGTSKAAACRIASGAETCQAANGDHASVDIVKNKDCIEIDACSKCCFLSYLTFVLQGCIHRCCVELMLHRFSCDSGLVPSLRGACSREQAIFMSDKNHILSVRADDISAFLPHGVLCPRSKLYNACGGVMSVPAELVLQPALVWGRIDRGRQLSTQEERQAAEILVAESGSTGESVLMPSACISALDEWEIPSFAYFFVDSCFGPRGTVEKLNRVSLGVTGLMQAAFHERWPLITDNGDVMGAVGDASGGNMGSPLAQGSGPGGRGFAPRGPNTLGVSQGAMGNVHPNSPQHNSPQSGVPSGMTASRGEHNKGEYEESSWRSGFFTEITVGLDAVMHMRMMMARFHRLINQNIAYYFEDAFTSRHEGLVGSGETSFPVVDGDVTSIFWDLSHCLDQFSSGLVSVFMKLAREDIGQSITIAINEGRNGAAVWVPEAYPATYNGGHMQLTSSGTWRCFGYRESELARLTSSLVFLAEIGGAAEYLADYSSAPGAGHDAHDPSGAHRHLRGIATHTWAPRRDSTSLEMFDIAQQEFNVDRQVRSRVLTLRSGLGSTVGSSNSVTVDPYTKKGGHIFGGRMARELSDSESGRDTDEYDVYDEPMTMHKLRKAAEDVATAALNSPHAPHLMERGSSQRRSKGSRRRSFSVASNGKLSIVVSSADLPDKNTAATRSVATGMPFSESCLVLEHIAMNSRGIRSDFGLLVVNNGGGDGALKTASFFTPVLNGVEPEIIKTESNVLCGMFPPLDSATEFYRSRSGFDAPGGGAYFSAAGGPAPDGNDASGNYPTPRIPLSGRPGRAVSTPRGGRDWVLPTSFFGLDAEAEVECPMLWSRFDNQFVRAMQEDKQFSFCATQYFMSQSLYRNSALQVPLSVFGSDSLAMMVDPTARIASSVSGAIRIIDALHRLFVVAREVGGCMNGWTNLQDACQEIARAIGDLRSCLASTGVVGTSPIEANLLTLSSLLFVRWKLVLFVASAALCTHDLRPVPVRISDRKDATISSQRYDAGRTDIEQETELNISLGLAGDRSPFALDVGSSLASGLGDTNASKEDVESRGTMLRHVLLSPTIDPMTLQLGLVAKDADAFMDRFVRYQVARIVQPLMLEWSTRRSWDDKSVPSSGRQPSLAAVSVRSQILALREPIVSWVLPDAVSAVHSTILIRCIEAISRAVHLMGPISGRNQLFLAVDIRVLIDLLMSLRGTLESVADVDSGHHLEWRRVPLSVRASTVMFGKNGCHWMPSGDALRYAGAMDAIDTYGDMEWCGTSGLKAMMLSDIFVEVILPPVPVGAPNLFRWSRQRTSICIRRLDLCVQELGIVLLMSCAPLAQVPAFVAESVITRCPPVGQMWLSLASPYAVARSAFAMSYGKCTPWTASQADIRTLSSVVMTSLETSTISTVRVLAMCGGLLKGGDAGDGSSLLSGALSLLNVVGTHGARHPWYVDTSASLSRLTSIVRMQYRALCLRAVGMWGPMCSAGFECNPVLVARRCSSRYGFVYLVSLLSMPGTVAALGDDGMLQLCINVVHMYLPLQVNVATLLSMLDPVTATVVKYAVRGTLGEDVVNMKMNAACAVAIVMFVIDWIQFMEYEERTLFSVTRALQEIDDVKLPAFMGKGSPAPSAAGISPLAQTSSPPLALRPSPVQNGPLASSVAKRASIGGLPSLTESGMRRFDSSGSFQRGGVPSPAPTPFALACRAKMGKGLRSNWKYSTPAIAIVARFLEGDAVFAAVPFFRDDPSSEPQGANTRSKGRSRRNPYFGCGSGKGGVHAGLGEDDTSVFDGLGSIFADVYRISRYVSRVSGAILYLRALLTIGCAPVMARVVQPVVSVCESLVKRGVIGVSVRFGAAGASNVDGPREREANPVLTDMDVASQLNRRLDFLESAERLATAAAHVGSSASLSRCILDPSGLLRDATGGEAGGGGQRYDGEPEPVTLMPDVKVEGRKASAVGQKHVDASRSLSAVGDDTDRSARSRPWSAANRWASFSKEPESFMDMLLLLVHLFRSEVHSLPSGVCAVLNVVAFIVGCGYNIATDGSRQRAKTATYWFTSAVNAKWQAAPDESRDDECPPITPDSIHPRDAAGSPNATRSVEAIGIILLHLGILPVLEEPHTYCIETGQVSARATKILGFVSQALRSMCLSCVMFSDAIRSDLSRTSLGDPSTPGEASSHIFAARMSLTGGVRRIRNMSTGARRDLTGGRLSSLLNVRGTAMSNAVFSSSRASLAAADDSTGDLSMDSVSIGSGATIGTARSHSQSLSMVGGAALSRALRGVSSGAPEVEIVSEAVWAAAADHVWPLFFAACVIGGQSIRRRAKRAWKPGGGQAPPGRDLHDADHELRKLSFALSPRIVSTHLLSLLSLGMSRCLVDADCSAAGVGPLHKAASSLKEDEAPVVSRVGFFAMGDDREEESCADSMLDGYDSSSGDSGSGRRGEGKKRSSSRGSKSRSLLMPIRPSSGGEVEEAPLASYWKGGNERDGQSEQANNGPRAIMKAHLYRRGITNHSVGMTGSNVIVKLVPQRLVYGIDEAAAESLPVMAESSLPQAQVFCTGVSDHHVGLRVRSTLGVAKTMLLSALPLFKNSAKHAGQQDPHSAAGRFKRKLMGRSSNGARRHGGELSSAGGAWSPPESARKHLSKRGGRKVSGGDVGRAGVLAPPHASKGGGLGWGKRGQPRKRRVLPPLPPFPTIFHDRNAYSSPDALSVCARSFYVDHVSPVFIRASYPSMILAARLPGRVLLLALQLAMSDETLLSGHEVSGAKAKKGQNRGSSRNRGTFPQRGDRQHTALAGGIPMAHGGIGLGGSSASFAAAVAGNSGRLPGGGGMHPGLGVGAPAGAIDGDSGKLMGDPNDPDHGVKNLTREALVRVMGPLSESWADDAIAPEVIARIVRDMERTAHQSRTWHRRALEISGHAFLRDEWPACFDLVGKLYEDPHRPANPCEFGEGGDGAMTDTSRRSSIVSAGWGSRRPSHDGGEHSAHSSQQVEARLGDSRSATFDYARQDRSFVSRNGAAHGTAWFIPSAREMMRANVKQRSDGHGRDRNMSMYSDFSGSADGKNLVHRSVELMARLSVRETLPWCAFSIPLNVTLGSHATGADVYECVRGACGPMVSTPALATSSGLSAVVAHSVATMHDVRLCEVKARSQVDSVPSPASGPVCPNSEAWRTKMRVSRRVRALTPSAFDVPNTELVMSAGIRCISDNCLDISVASAQALKDTSRRKPARASPKSYDGFYHDVRSLVEILLCVGYSCASSAMYSLIARRRGDPWASPCGVGTLAWSALGCALVAEADHCGLDPARRAANVLRSVICGCHDGSVAKTEEDKQSGLPVTRGWAAQPFDDPNASGAVPATEDVVSVLKTSYLQELPHDRRGFLNRVGAFMVQEWDRDELGDTLSVPTLPKLAQLSAAHALACETMYARLALPALGIVSAVTNSEHYRCHDIHEKLSSLCTTPFEQDVAPSCGE